MSWSRSRRASTSRPTSTGRASSRRPACHVVYGLVGLKTHCKLALVVRQEPDGSLRRYAHIGTGNYNPKTARLYEDLGLLTDDPAIGTDVADLFNELSGYTKQRTTTPCWSRRTHAQRLLERIEQEADNARAACRPASGSR